MADPSVAQAIAFGTSATGTTLAKTSVTTTAGNGLLIAVSIRDTTTVSSISDGVHTWVLDGRVGRGTSDQIDFEVWKTTDPYPAALAAATVTINFSGTTQSAVSHLFEIANGNPTALVDKSHYAVVGATNTASVDSGLSGTLTAANELAIGFCATGGGARTGSSGTFTQGAPSTSKPSATGFDAGTGTSQANLQSNWLLITSTTSQKFTETLNLAAVWAGGVTVLARRPVGLVYDDRRIRRNSLLRR